MKRMKNRTLEYERLLPTLLGLLAVLLFSALAQAQPAEERGHDGPRDDGFDRPMMHEGEGPRTPGGPGGVGGPGGAGVGRLTPEMRQRLLEVLKDVHPELAQRLEQSGDGEGFEREAGPMMNRLRERMGELMYLKKHDEAMYQLKVRDIQIQRQTMELVRRSRESGDTEAVQAELRPLVEEHFQVRQEMREKELAKLEQRIEELKEQLERRAANEDELIEERIEMLLNRAEKSDW